MNIEKVTRNNHQQISAEIAIACQNLPTLFAFAVAAAILKHSPPQQPDKRRWINPKTKNRSGAPSTLQPRLPLSSDFIQLSD